ncbi:MAG TPA: hypothetical protein DCS93_12155 [Microscillaceae bacterium]|nr:hypothetical protein [Microscillaceae bacterium]
MQTKLEKQADQLWERYKEYPKFWNQYETLVQSAQQQVQRRVVPEQVVSETDLIIAYEALSHQKVAFYNEEKKSVVGFKMSILTGLLLVITGVILGVLFPGDILLYVAICGIVFSNLEYRFFDTPMPKMTKRSVLELKYDFLVIKSGKILRKVFYKEITQIKVKKQAILIKVKSGRKLRLPLYNQQLKKMSLQEYQPLLQFLELITYHNK